MEKGKGATRKPDDAQSGKEPRPGGSEVLNQYHVRSRGPTSVNGN